MPTIKQVIEAVKLMNAKGIPTENRHVFPRERRKHQGSYIDRQGPPGVVEIRASDSIIDKTDIKISSPR